MATVAVICMLAGTFLQALNGIIQALLINKYKAMTVRGVLLAEHGLGFLFLLSTLWWWNTFAGFVGLQTSAKADPIIFWIAVVWTTFWNATVIQYASAKSMQAADASLVTPYQGITPGFITGSMLLFKEIPSTIAVIGIGIISGGTYVHGREKIPLRLNAWREWLRPFEVIFRTRLPENYETLNAEQKREEERKSRNNQIGVRWALTSAAAGTMGLLGDGIASRHGEITIFYTFYMGAIFTWWLILPLLWTKTKNSAKNLKNSYPGFGTLIRIRWYWILLLGLSYALRCIFVATAFRVAPVSYIGTLKRFQIVITIALAWWILKERVGRRLITGSIITLGAILVGLDPEPQTQILNSAEEYAYIIKSWFGLE